MTVAKPGKVMGLLYMRERVKFLMESVVGTNGIQTPTMPEVLNPENAQGRWAAAGSVSHAQYLNVCPADLW